MPVRIAAGELLDKITILEIKAERIEDPTKREHVRAELAAPAEARDRSIFDPKGIQPLMAELRIVNEAPWEVAERPRECERSGEFGPGFVELARSMCRDNDRRAATKRRINERVRSELIGGKSYGRGRRVRQSRRAGILSILHLIVNPGMIPRWSGQIRQTNGRPSASKRIGRDSADL